MKKILFINILALILGAVQLSGQCNNFIVIGQSTDETCAVANDGTATAQTVGGNMPITYTWSTGATTETITGLTAGSYTATVVDASSCVSITIVQVELSPEGIWLMPSSTPVSCFGGSDGTAYPGVMSGTAPYTYLWDDPNNQTTETAVGLTAGQYNVTVTDVNGCSNVTPVTVDSPPELVNVITNTTNVVCLTDSNGSITASAFGGTGSITYTWSNGGSGGTISGLPLGTYTVTATDANGCTATTFSKVGLISPVVSAFTSGTNVVCFGANDGTATVNASSGLPPYTYLWSNGQTGATATGLAPGNYDVTVTDANGCTWVSTAGSSSVTIDQPSEITISDINITNVACHGESTGSASINAFGGTGTLSYSWSNGVTGNSITGLAAGTYTGTITDTNGCISTQEVTITEPSPVTASGTGTNPTAAGSDGSIDLTVGGGTPGYTYLWSNGATTQNISGLTGGCYTATVTDANGCTVESTTCIEDPMNPPTVTTIPTSECSTTGSATANANSGTAPYTYSWSNGGTTQTITGLSAGSYTVTVTDANGMTSTSSGDVGTIPNPTVAGTGSTTTCGESNGTASSNPSGGAPGYTYSWSNGSTTQNISGLSPGTYTVTVTDTNGCTGTTEVVVAPGVPTVTITTTGTGPTTPMGTDGSVTANVSFGTAPYTYSWSNGGTTQTIMGLSAGCYTVTVTDANNCSAESTTCIEDPMNPPTVTTTPTSECSTTGSATANANSGTAPYTYSWSNGGTTQTITGLSAGSYTVTVTDANGMTSTSSGDVGTIPNPTVTGTGSTTTCGESNGTASSNPSGGAPGYTYEWSNGSTTQNISGLSPGTYTVTVTDTNGCIGTTEVVVAPGAPTVTITTSGTGPTTPMGTDGSVTANASFGTAPYTYLWSNGETTPTITGLSAGCYTVTVTDANNCSAESTTCIEDPMNPPTVTTTTTPTSGCSTTGTGSATANASSGTPPYSYLWSNGGDTQTITGLTAGSYTVTVTDDNGMTATSTAVVGTIPNPTIVGTGSATTCGEPNGTASSIPSGGTPGYTYLWSNGETTQNISGLSPGTYTVTVTDTNGCTATTEVVVQPGGAPVVVMTNGTDPNTPMGMNGFVTANVTAGTPAYSYLWSNGGTTQTIMNLSAGCYTVTVTDANNCTATAESCIEDPEPLIIDTNSTPSNECSGASTGTATAVVTQGVAPFTYLWSNGGTTETITNLSPGSYTVTVTDAAGSTASSTVVVGSVPMPSVVGTGSNITCGINDGTAMSMPGGGTPGYTYEWSTGETTQDISGLSPGTYTVTVTDTNGCTATTEVNVIEISPAVNVTTSGTGPTTPMGMNGFVTATVTGGSQPFTYLWSNGGTTQTINGLSAGCYTVTVTDNNNCTAESTACIEDPEPLQIEIITTPSLECNGDNDGTATVTVIDGTAPYTYLWSDGQDTPTATGLTPGTYTVTVTDANGSVAVETVVIESLPSPTVSETSTGTECGLANGSATAIGSGGTPLAGGDYNYLWSNGSTSSTINGQSAGNYTVTITDANGCTATTQVNIPENSPAATVTTVETNITANGANDGTITATPIGTAPYTYLWSNGETTQTISGLSVGCYTVTVTDANDCTATSVSCIEEPPVLSITTASEPDDCTAGADGTATATVLTGTADYTFLWSDGQDTPTATGLAPGTYTVTVTDATGATITQEVTVDEIEGPDASAMATDISCNGIGDGTLEASATNGTAPYTYEWNTPNNDDTLFVGNLNPGVYTVTVTDANGCTDVATTTIAQDDPIDALSSIVPIECAGGTAASIAVIPSGGTAPYSYEWSTMGTDSIVSDLTAGTYTVTITDANGCTAEQTFPIADAPPIALAIEGDTVACDGVEMLVATTGMVDSILWTDANGTVLGSGTSYELIAAQGTNNMIFATAYGANGCTGMDSTVVIVPEALELELSPQDTMVECEQTMLELSANNPNVVSYTWYDDSALSNEIGTGGELPSFLSSAPQFYYVEAEDMYGCTVVDSVFAGHTEIISTLEQNVQACIGDSLVLIPSAISTANATISYTWVDGNGVMLGTEPTLNLDPASDGMYIVQMTDEYGCFVEDSTNVSVYDLLPLLSATADEDTILTGMESQLIALPDDEGFSYLWSNAGTITQGSETDRDPMVSPMETTNYQVTVTNDENGCSALTNVLVTVIDPSCDEPFIFFPNAFSPNDDGVNDVLYLRGSEVIVDEVYFMIFNRWGQKVFESNSQQEGWDGVFKGKKVCNDVYGFYLRVRCTNGDEYIKKGNVTVFN